MIAYMLGRRPDEFGLVPDAEGFVKVKDLLKALHEEEGWGYVNLSHLNEVLLSVSVPTFEIAENRIRARVRETSAVASPPPPLPKLLYACIRRKAQFHVQAEGIQPSSQSHVVLSSDRSLAERLGKRIDPDPVILTVNVSAALDMGVQFFQQGESLFLADSIPPGCFSGPPLPKEKPEDARRPHPPGIEEKRSVPAGSFLMDPERASSPHVPASLKRRSEKGSKLDRQRFKKDKRMREKPPWRK
jgi:putative RNA 2'-phosphotransferase